MIEKQIMDTEDKLTYCQHASNIQEPEFVKFFNTIAGQNIKIFINPDKENDKFTHDLIIKTNNKTLKADLKSQFTPFYMAKSLYGIDPQWAVTYNHKDYVRYKEQYTKKNVPLYLVFDVFRIPEENLHFDVEILKMRAIFIADVRKIEELIENKSVSLHTYKNRIGDGNGNARDSYVLDTRTLPLVYYSGKGVILK